MFSLVNLDSNTTSINQGIDLDFKMSGNSQAAMGDLVSGNGNRALLLMNLANLSNDSSNYFAPGTTDNRVTGKGNSISANSNRIQGDNNSIKAASNSVTGNSNSVSGANNRIQGSSNNVTGNNDRVSGNNHYVTCSNCTVGLLLI